MNSKVQYTCLESFDTHNDLLAIHKNNVSELNDTSYSFPTDMQTAKLLKNGTIVVFSEFGRRVKDNGNGTTAPMFIIGGSQ